MEDYRERLIEEYGQLSERFQKLGAFIDQALEGTLEQKLNCPIEILMTQYFAMQTYLSVLDMRIKLESAAQAAEAAQESEVQTEE